MRAGLRACSFFVSSFGASPFGGREGGFSLCTLPSTLFRTHVLFVALPDMTKPPVDLSEVPGVPCYHLVGVIIVPQRGRDCKLTVERCGQVGGRRPVHLVHSATGAATQDGQPREMERGSSQNKHPGTHGRTGRPPQRAATARRRGQGATTLPQRQTAKTGDRPRRPPGATTERHPPAPRQRPAHARRTTETPAARRDAARRKPTQTANPGAGNATDEQGQAGEEPTPKRPSPPHPQTRRGPPTQPARKLPRRCRYRRNRLSLA